jgi:hypothetical protein
MSILVGNSANWGDTGYFPSLTMNALILLRQLVVGNKVDTVGLGVSGKTSHIICTVRRDFNPIDLSFHPCANATASNGIAKVW